MPLLLHTCRRSAKHPRPRALSDALSNVIAHCSLAITCSTCSTLEPNNMDRAMPTNPTAHKTIKNEMKLPKQKKIEEEKEKATRV